MYLNQRAAMGYTARGINPALGCYPKGTLQIFCCLLPYQFHKSHYTPQPHKRQKMPKNAAFWAKTAFWRGISKLSQQTHELSQETFKLSQQTRELSQETFELSQET